MTKKKVITSSEEFAELLLKDREKSTRKRKEERWSGTFSEYLNLVKDGTVKPKLAHKTIYDMIMKYGITEIDPADDPRLRRMFRLHAGEKIIRYNFFKDDFFGIDATISKIVAYFKAGADRGEESRQVLYLIGPVSGGKSSLVLKIARGLEKEYFYAIKGCPMQEEPLHLIPNHLRDRFQDILGVRIEGDLCLYCRYLLSQHDNKHEKIPVEKTTFSVRNQRGIAQIPPVDPNAQDVTVLIGSMEIANLTKFPSNHPEVLKLDGAMNKGNRGFCEWIELFKNSGEYLHPLITATQEKNIPAPEGRRAMIYVDEVQIAHSNEAEYNKFIADKTNEALVSRIRNVKVPYVMSLNEEIRIYEKLISMSDFTFHRDPHLLEMVSKFALLTRCVETNKASSLVKIRIYNGEEVVEKGKSLGVDIDELRAEAPNEGMNGIEPRFIMKAIGRASYKSPKCVDCNLIREVLQELILEDEEEPLSEELKQKYTEVFLKNVLYKDHLEQLQGEVTRAFVHAYNEQAESLFQNILDHAEALLRKKTVKDRISEEELDPDIELLKDIATQVGVTGDKEMEGFYQDFLNHAFEMMRAGEMLNYRSYTPLKKAIEKKLSSNVKDLVRITTKARVRDREQGEKYDEVIKKMIEENGFCECCAERTIRYVSNNWKD